MIKYLHANGVRVGLNLDPKDGIYPFETNYEKITQYLKADEDGVIPFNAFDPRFMDVYLKLLIHPLENIDVDFYWLDS